MENTARGSCPFSFLMAGGELQIVLKTQHTDLVINIYECYYYYYYYYLFYFYFILTKITQLLRTHSMPKPRDTNEAWDVNPEYNKARS
jgi:hypothetical protein